MTFIEKAMFDDPTKAVSYGNRKPASPSRATAASKEQDPSHEMNEAEVSASILTCIVLHLEA